MERDVVLHITQISVWTLIAAVSGRSRSSLQFTSVMGTRFLRERCSGCFNYLDFKASCKNGEMQTFQTEHPINTLINNWSPSQTIYITFLYLNSKILEIKTNFYKNLIMWVYLSEVAKFHETCHYEMKNMALVCVMMWMIPQKLILFR